MSPRGVKQNENMRADALVKISAAALEVFAEYGYHGATMRRIAERAGLSGGLVYHYFPSKEKVFRYLVDFALDSSIAGMQGAIASPGTAWQKIEAHATLVIETMFEGKTSLFFLIILQAMTQGKGVRGLQAHVAKRSEAYYQLIVPLIVQAQQSGEATPGEPTVLAAAYFSFIQGLATLIFQGKGLEKRITPEILSGVLRRKAG